MEKGYTRARAGAGGFTLIEVLMASAIVGIGMAALLTAAHSHTQANGRGRDVTQATFLAEGIREWTLTLPFRDPDTPDNSPGSDGSSPQVWVDDLDDLMDVTYSPPRDALGVEMSDLDNWSQTITMTWRDPANLETEVTAGSSNIVHVEVTIVHNSESVLTTSWLIVERTATP